MSLGKPNQQWSVGRRDAFHVPAILVWSDQHLRAGDAVVFTNRACEKVLLSPITTCHGIVDPWGDAVIMPGYKFWVLLNSGLASDLRHEFIVTLNEDKTIMDRLAESTAKMQAATYEPEGETRCEREGCGFAGN